MARAQREGSRAEFVRADVQTHAFEPATMDMVVSRFGVMFFDDPVAAFANLRRASTGDVALRLIAWRSAAENPFSTAAERAAAPLLPDLPARNPDGPGQFAFGSAARVRPRGRAAGPAPTSARSMSNAHSRTELDAYLTRLGPRGCSGADGDRARIMVIRPRPLSV